MADSESIVNERLRQAAAIGNGFGMSGFFGYEVDPCWNCGSPRMEQFRYCPNCGLWLVNRTPLRYSRGQNHDGSVGFTLAVDDGQQQHRVPDFASLSAAVPESSDDGA